jgi:O-antigen ligase
MPLALAALTGLTAWGAGGYEPWAALALELGSVFLAGFLFVRTLFRTSREDRERFLAIQRSQRRGTTEVEIVEPTSTGSPRAPYPDPFFFLGYPFRKNGVGLLVSLATVWVVLSLMPLPPAVLALLSPKALAIRSGAEGLLGRESSLAPWSLTPFLTFQDLLLWIAFVALFVAAHHAVSSRKGARRLSIALLLLGIASGGYRLGQWLIALGGKETADLFHASGSFGNRNHYALFQEMLLMIGLGWLSMTWLHARTPALDRVEAQEKKAKASMVVLGVGLIALSLLFSLSRSGIAFAAAGAALFLYLNRGARRSYVAIAVAGVLAAALWIGIDPVVSRFGFVADDLAGGSGRTAVWRDSLGAVSDFWLTGSGASSFQYVYPMYRSFGGRRFYSWAHNDYLQVGVEFGIPGLALTAALAIAILRRARRVRRDLLDSGSSLVRLHAGYCAAAFAAALHSFTDFGLHLPANAALFVVVLAAVTGIVPPSSAKRLQEKQGAKRVVLRRAA